jgi:hypothetical protein
MNRAGSSRLVAATALAVAAVAPLVLFTGCPKPHQLSTPDGKRDEKGDPWEAAARQLRQGNDPATCKAALGQLNTALGNRTDVPSPAALTPEAEKALTAVVPLTPVDLQEVRPTGFSNLDPAYLAECFYLHDAARSLDVAGLPPAAAADLAFAWACRQIYINPWRLPWKPGQDITAVVPPTYSLRRGSGSGLDRAYAFLSLLQQVGLDGCLIGPPDAGDKVAAPPFPDSAKVAPRGPFWAVGVRAGSEVRLYDPWRGVAFPGTLAQLKANPDLLKSWFEDKADPWGVTADEVKKAAVFLAVPVSALSTRMAMLDERLKADSGVRLAAHPAALRDRFTAAAPGGPGLPAAEVKFRNPPEDRLTYGRALMGFLPVGEGGNDTEKEGLRLYDQYIRDQVPQTVIQLPRALVEREPQERLRAVAFLTYKITFLDSPTPRERLQRGQFQDTARFLTEKQDEFDRGLARLRNASEKDIADWCKTANELYAGLGRARLDGDATQVATAQAAIDRFWQTQTQTAQVIVDRASASVGKVEATYLLALTKHEEAERAQARADRAAGPDAAAVKADAVRAWKQAADLWAAYAQQKEAHAGFPGRAAHAQVLADRANKLAAAK